MIDPLKTLYKSVTAQLKDLRKRAVWNKKEMRHIMLMIILTDLIEWSNSITKADPKWYKIREEYLMNHPEFLVQRVLTKYEDELYTNVNTPQSDEFWDRIWDQRFAIITKKLKQPAIPVVKVFTQDVWIEIPVVNGTATIDKEITGIQSEIQFILPDKYYLEDAYNGTMQERGVHDCLLDDIHIYTDEQGVERTKFVFDIPLNEPIILVLNHE